MSESRHERPVVPGHRVESVIGRGGSGTVWSGRDAMGRPVAIKVPHEAAWVDDDEVVGGAGAASGAAVGGAEAHVLLAVRHEHLVTLRDVVELADGRVALVFDLVDGALLRSTVQARGRLRPGEVVTVLTPLCEAVAVLHGAAGLHGDISPSNVMVTARGKPLLLDLGAARLCGTPLDAPVFGTAGFVAPEVREGLAPTEASDVFSLGAVAWFCLTGNGSPDTMLRLDPDTVRSHVGPELADIIGACIDPDPARRPTAAALARLVYDAAPAEAIEVVVGADEATALTHRLRAEAREDPEPPDGADRSSTLRRWWPPRLPSVRPVFALLGLAVVVAALLGVGILTARGTASAHEPPQRPVANSARSSGPSAVATRSASASSVTPRGTATAHATAATAVTTSPATPRSGDAVIRAADAPRVAAADLVQRLSDRRAAALTARDPRALSGVDAAASPASAADAALIARLHQDGTRWEGLRLEVAQAAPVSVSDTRAVVRARVDWTAYTVVSGGVRQPQPAATGRLLDFTLVRGSDGWRLASVSAPTS